MPVFSILIPDAHAAGKKGDGPPSIADAFAPAVNLLLYVAILFWFVGRKIPGLLRDRRVNVQDQIQKSMSTLKDAEAKLKESEEKLKSVEAESRALVEKARTDATALREKLIQEGKELRDSIVENAKRTAEAEFDKARDALRKEVIDQATGRAEKLIKSQLRDEDHQRVFEGSLEQIGGSRQ